MRGENYIEKMSKLLENYLNKNKNGSERMILVPITRKGYWIFKLFLENDGKSTQNCKVILNKSQVLEKFEIYSDRYLTKSLDVKKFQGKKVILFDDLVVTGNNLFYYFVLLKKWNHDIEKRYADKSTDQQISIDILTLYRDLFSGKEDKRFEDTEKLSYCKKILREGDYDFEKLREKFWQLQDQNRFLTTLLVPDDIARISVDEVRIFDKNLCPMTIDLPIMISGNDTNGLEGFLKKGIRIKKQIWQKMQKDPEWQFIENKSVETLDVEINASFFEAAKCMGQLAGWNQIEDCIVKCKYKEEEDFVYVIFVPFVIMKSMNYFELIQMFCKLYKGTVYGKEIMQDVPDQIVPESLLRINVDVNLYRTLYRAVVFYFSIFLGKKFEKYVTKYLSQECDFQNWEFKPYIKVDTEFMEDHLPEKLLETFQSFLDEDIWDMEQKLSCKPEADVEIEIYSPGRKEIAYDKWQQIYYHVKEKLIEIRFGRTDRDMLTIEEMESEIRNIIPEIGDMERRITIARIITLFQESCSFSNYLVNDSEWNMVERGFKPGENAIKLLGDEALAFVPYIYAQYLKVGEDNFYFYYKRFVDRMRAHFYEKKYFEYRISLYAFEFLESYFAKEEGDTWGIERKIPEVRYLLDDYLNGNSREYDAVFELVYEWEV